MITLQKTYYYPSSFVFPTKVRHSGFTIIYCELLSSSSHLLHVLVHHIQSPYQNRWSFQLCLPWQLHPPYLSVHIVIIPTFHATVPSPHCLPDLQSKHVDFRCPSDVPTHSYCPSLSLRWKVVGPSDICIRQHCKFISCRFFRR